MSQNEKQDEWAKDGRTQDDDANVAEIIARVAAGEITAISVDTSIFDANKQRLDKGLFAKLRQFGRGAIDLVFPDAVWAEISSHLLDNLGNSRKKFNKDILDLCEFVGGDVGELNALQQRLDAMPDIMHARDQQLKKFLDETKAEVITAGKYVTVDEIMALYFEKKPPFQTTGPKRKEFPDAVALRTLEGWARDHHKQILVVSKDPDWKNYCVSSEHLFFTNDLATALTIFNSAKDYKALLTFVWKELENPESDLMTRIEGELAEYDWSAKAHIEAHSQFEFDDDIVELVKISSLRFEDGFDGIGVIDEEKNLVSVSARVVAELVLSVGFEFSKWDGIDKDHVAMGTASIEGSAEIEVEVILNIGLNGAEIDNIDLEIHPAPFGLELGEIEPSWMSDPDNFE